MAKIIQVIRKSSLRNFDDLFQSVEKDFKIFICRSIEVLVAPTLKDGLVRI